VSNDDLPEWILRHRWEVGGRIRQARRERGLTQEQLAELVSVDVKTISRAENGRYQIGIDQVARIARALAVPSARLFPND
jgi:UDP-N-acetylglucosamine 1-carboxyvinyltransferase